MILCQFETDILIDIFFRRKLDQRDGVLDLESYGEFACYSYPNCRKSIIITQPADVSQAAKEATNSQGPRYPQ